MHVYSILFTFLSSIIKTIHKNNVYDGINIELLTRSVCNFLVKITRENMKQFHTT